MQSTDRQRDRETDRQKNNKMSSDMGSGTVAKNLQNLEIK